MDTEHHGHGHGHAKDPRIKHETTDVDLRTVDRVGILTVLVLAVAMVSMWGLFRYFQYRADARDAERAVPRAARPEFAAAGPRLQTDEPADLQRFLEAESAVLEQYEWIDREAGIVRIPISRAIELVSERGLPRSVGVTEVEEPQAAPPAEAALPPGGLAGGGPR